MLSIEDRNRILQRASSLLCNVCLKLAGMDTAASGKYCKTNKHLKRSRRPNSLCAYDDCNYDSTICRKLEKENLKFQSILKDGIRWKNQKLKDLGHKEPEVTLVTEVSEQEGKIACSNA